MSLFERVHVTPAALQDINRIVDIDAKEAIVGALLEIEKNLEYGKPLEIRPETGDLRGCRKVYVDKSGDFEPRYRIVYWLAPDEHLPRQARVISVGLRARLQAYEAAVRRYNRDRASMGLAPVEEQTDIQLGVRE